MSKVVIFKGSPRKNGYTTRLLEQVAKGAKSKGAEVIEFDLNDSGIRGCQGCYYCKSHEGCATKDYLQPMYEDLKNAAGIIVGSPIYFGAITGQVKQWFDRMLPMIADTFEPRYPGKKVVTIFAQGNGNKDMFQNAIHSFNDYFSFFGWDLTDSLLCYDTSSPNFKLSDELLKQAFAAGELLSK
jgi:multimeric flavodoxin WrbA